MAAKHAVQRLRDIVGSWEAVANTIGVYSAAYWCQVAAGNQRMSQRADTALRRACALPPRTARGRWERLRPAELAVWVRERREVRV